MTNFEKGAQEVPDEESPVEKDPKEIERESRHLLSSIVLKARDEGASVADINKWGGEVLARIDKLHPIELRAVSDSEKKGIEGLEMLSDYAELVSSIGDEAREIRETIEEMERAIELFKESRRALVEKNGGLPPTPELDQLPTKERNKDVGEKSNP
ncbi:hypothetical protein E3J85_01310 [Patescibacteria group bacterium]|nr:MAG: hypothetical protein E3J85_01310 [Patescibacteria group bacterium]